MQYNVEIMRVEWRENAKTTGTNPRITGTLVAVVKQLKYALPRCGCLYTV